MGEGSGCGGKRTILHSNTGSIFLMILIAHFCLIIIIAPLDPFSLRFSNFQKMTTKKPKEKKRSVGIHFGTSGLDYFFFVNDMEDFFLSAFHTHFSLKYKCKIKNWVDVVLW